MFSIGFSIASSCFQPVKNSATGFKNNTLPFVSVAITASAILLSVVESHPRDFSNSSVLSFTFFSKPRSDSFKLSSIFEICLLNVVIKKPKPVKINIRIKLSNPSMLIQLNPKKVGKKIIIPSKTKTTIKPLFFHQ